MASHNVGKVAQYAHRVWDVPESDDKKAMALEGVTRLKFFGIQKQTDNPVFRHDNLKYHSFTLFHVL